MTDCQLQIPVAFLVFNRLDTTIRVFDVIRKVQPRKLFVVSDGARSDRPQEMEKCAAVRCFIESNIDWPCKLMKHYSERNLGCDINISKGLTWVFENVEQAIILEDDCVPDISFFFFCEELLTRYADDERVMAVTAFNWQGRTPGIDTSYYFSKHFNGWGWATWRRAWDCFDYEMKRWPRLRDRKFLNDIFHCKKAARCRKQLLDRLYEAEAPYWDFVFDYSIKAQSGLSINPSVNLVQNIGFGHEDATHTKTGARHLSLPAHSMEFPLAHSSEVLRDYSLDRVTERARWMPPPIYRRLHRIPGKLLRMLRGRK